MVTISKVITIIKGKSVIEGDCLSTDTKPTKYANGSTLIEMDTGTVYKYDDENDTWRAWA